MGGGTDGDASMRYQHTNTSHNRSSGFSSVAEIAGGMGLRSPQPQQLALDFAPAQVRSHGLRDAHTYPQVARSQGASFRVPASQAWGYPSLELRAGNSWPLMGFDCDVPEKVLEALVSNHWGARSDSCPALPEPNMIVQRRSNSHSHVSYFLAKPVHRGATAREAPLRLFARRIEFVKENLTFTGEDSPLANLMLSVMGAFAEFERALIRERQREGIALAKQRGAYRGRKKSLSPEQTAQLRQRVQAGEQKAPLAREFGISRETLYQYLRTQD